MPRLVASCYPVQIVYGNDGSWDCPHLCNSANYCGKEDAALYALPSYTKIVYCCMSTSSPTSASTYKPTQKPTDKPTDAPAVTPTVAPTASPTRFHVVDNDHATAVDSNDFRDWCDANVPICPCGTVTNGTHCGSPLDVADDPTFALAVHPPPLALEQVCNYVRCAEAWKLRSAERARHYLVQSFVCAHARQEGRALDVANSITVTCTNNAGAVPQQMHVLNEFWEEVDLEAEFSAWELDWNDHFFTISNAGLVSNVSIAAIRLDGDICNGSPDAARVEVDGLNLEDFRDPNDMRNFLIPYHPSLVAVLHSSSLVADDVYLAHRHNATLAGYLSGVAYVLANTRALSEYDGVYLGATPLGASTDGNDAFLENNLSIQKLCANVCPCGSRGPKCSVVNLSPTQQLEHSIALARCALLHYEIPTRAMPYYTDITESTMLVPRPATGSTLLHGLGIYHLPETYLTRALYCVRYVAGPGRGSSVRLPPADEELAARALLQLVDIALAVLERAPADELDSTRVLAVARTAASSLDALTNQDFFAGSTFVPELGVDFSRSASRAP